MPRLIPPRRTAARGGGEEPGGDPDRPRRATAAATAGPASGPACGPDAAPPATRTGFGVPAFAHPLVAPAEWAELARPGAPLDWVAFDVSRGPGSRPDPLYREALTRVRENRVPLLGLLDAVHGTRPFRELIADASHYLDWYRVDGFYLKRAPTLQAGAAECRRVVTTLRALLGGADSGGAAADSAADPAVDQATDQATDQAAGSAAAPAAKRRRPVVLAPGSHPYPGYAEFADQLVTFDGPWFRYRWSEAPEWTASYPPCHFVHLVHGVPAIHLDTALRIARWQGAGTVCLTDRSDREGADPWAGLPGYWHEAVRKVRRQG